MLPLVLRVLALCRTLITLSAFKLELGISTVENYTFPVERGLFLEGFFFRDVSQIGAPGNTLGRVVLVYIFAFMPQDIYTQMSEIKFHQLELLRDLMCKITDSDDDLEYSHLSDHSVVLVQSHGLSCCDVCVQSVVWI